MAEEENQQKRREFIMQRLDHWAERFTKTEWVEQAQRLHFPASPVSTTLDLVKDPQILARGFLTAVDHPEFGKINFPQGAIASALGNRPSRAPKLGEHNAETLNDLPKNAGR